MSEDVFSLPLADYILTFDDGLYSQFAFLSRLSTIPTDKIFFISTKYICEGQQSGAFIDSRTAHDKARTGVYEDFMTVDQIQQIMNTPGCYIGGHGHAHVRMDLINRKVDQIQTIIADTTEMLDTFDRVFGLTPTKFCFPYNNDVGELYPTMLRRYGFTEFYGRERIPVETLLRN